MWKVDCTACLGAGLGLSGSIAPGVIEVEQTSTVTQKSHQVSELSMQAVMHYSKPTQRNPC
jgi:hypothetical protein